MPREDGTGICPSCGGEGPVAAPCGEGVCARRGYHFVPPEGLARRPGREPDPRIGRAIGEWLVVGVLGAGGFGCVYLVLQLPIRMRAALKLLHHDVVEGAMAEALVAKFEGEAQALAALNHPNVVRLLKYGLHEGAPYLVMEYVGGGQTLKDLLAAREQRGQPLGRDEIRAILRQVVDGLEAAHALGIVHRDIKPENVMVQPVAGNPLLVRILDFGLAKFVAERAENSMAMGTPSWMAPEQLGAGLIGPWTDLYAVGAMAFELLTGRRPFPGRTQREILARKLDPAHDPTAALEDLDLAPPVRAFFRRALARDPGDRYRDAEAFRRGLDGALEALEPPAARAPAAPAPVAPGGAGTAVLPGPPAPAAAPAARPGRRGLVAALVAAAVLAAGAVAAFLLLRPGGDGAPAGLSLPDPDANGLVWIPLPGGTFAMGSAEGEAHERPVHEVTLQPFQMARTETTIAQYRACVDAGGCTAPKGRHQAAGVEALCTWGLEGRDDHGVNCVTWEQARAFCAWAGGRLPTEAEWEYAARGAGRDVRYPWGDAPPSCSVAVFGGERGVGCGEGHSLPVCARPSGQTPQGLCDMAGGMWEWVADWYAEDAYAGHAARDPDGPASGTRKVSRSGGYGSEAKSLRVAHRMADPPDSAGVDGGFRCARPGR